MLKFDERVCALTATKSTASEFTRSRMRRITDSAVSLKRYPQPTPRSQCSETFGLSVIRQEHYTNQNGATSTHAFTVS
jgi:hypothetical protein